METAKQDFNQDVKSHFKKQRKYVSNDGLIIFYTLNDKKLYDLCVDKHTALLTAQAVKRATGLKDKNDLK
jgi:hypothetical protein